MQCCLLAETAARKRLRSSSSINKSILGDISASSYANSSPSVGTDYKVNDENSLNVF